MQGREGCGEGPRPGPGTPAPSFLVTKHTVGPPAYLGQLCQAKNSGKLGRQVIHHMPLLSKARGRQGAEVFCLSVRGALGTACAGLLEPVVKFEGNFVNCLFVKHLIIQN